MPPSASRRRKNSTGEPLPEQAGTATPASAYTTRSLSTPLNAPAGLPPAIDTDAQPTAVMRGEPPAPGTGASAGGVAKPLLVRSVNGEATSSAGSRAGTPSMPAPLRSARSPAPISSSPSSSSAPAVTAAGEGPTPSVPGEAPMSVGNVKVAVRIRPPKAAGEPGPPVVRRIPGTTSGLTITDGEKRGPREFAFDQIFDEAATQEDVYKGAVQPLVERCLAGPYNGCIFCYGQTSSGKTYTMGTSPGDGVPAGIIQRVAVQIMRYVEERRESTKGKIELKVAGTYLEIYQETLTDLLLPKSHQAELKIRLDPDSPTGKDLYVEGITVRSLPSVKAWDQLLQIGKTNRTVAETSMNEASSRSHAVMTIYIEENIVGWSKGGDRAAANAGRKWFKIHLIDLAGSERADSTGAVGARLKEGAAINQSLSALGNVINALTSKTRTHVPYRDSKLTYLLSDSLGANAVTLMLACASPAAANAPETLNTLRFAERVKKVKNLARVQMDPTTIRLLELEAENRALRERLAKCTCGQAAGLEKLASTVLAAGGAAAATAPKRPLGRRVADMARGCWKRASRACRGCCCTRDDAASFKKISPEDDGDDAAGTAAAKIEANATMQQSPDTAGPPLGAAFGGV